MGFRVHFANALWVVALIACASSGTTAGAAPRRSSMTITGDEMVAAGVSNVYDAIQRLRPQWLTSSRMRGAGTSDELQVYIDMNRYGALESLRQLPIGGIAEARYLNAAEATNRYGTGHSGGVILIMLANP
ncbi:MAG TPA: hypothetical protein VJ867_14905 [Gemmatimonadaceae bacterium]|nr:hypothetical protein [Gemmatimonadaceae bacterium]